MKLESHADYFLADLHNADRSISFDFKNSIDLRLKVLVQDLNASTIGGNLIRSLGKNSVLFSF